jgi:LysR family transcriptional activator of nhaA
LIPTITLNFHHLQYFWAVAKDGNLTRTAQRLRVAQSALSAQIRALEAQLGQALFARQGRGLVLTEGGRIALAYAEQIFAAGGDLVATFHDGRRRQPLLRIGAVATLSRNFQRSFVRPLLEREHVHLRLIAGGFEELLSQLSTHDLDIVLANRPAPSPKTGPLRSRRLARQPVSIVGATRSGDFRFPEDIDRQPMVVPGLSSEIRMEFDALCERLGVHPTIRAEVDDMATMRLIARDTDALVLVPSVVVRDELREGLLRELCALPDVSETFYAITAERRFQHPLLSELLDREEAHLLGEVRESDTPASPAPSRDAHVTTRPRRKRKD